MVEYRVRNMRRADLEYAYAWSVQEGWNIGKHDHDVFFATDPNGFFLGELAGEPVGSVSGVAYDAPFGFIGIYIVRPEFRGMGYGLPLFQAAMDYLGKRNIGLDAVLAQQDNYRRSGFQLAYRNIRYQGLAPRLAQELPPAPGGGEAQTGCIPVTDIPFEQLLDYDARHFPAQRSAFLQAWLQEPDSTAYAVVESGALRGYGMIRAFVHGYSIAPLFADTPEIAARLFQALAGQRPGQTLFLDVPEINPAAIALATHNQMSPVFETARMYTGQPPKLPMHQIFGITSFELG